MKTLKDFFDDVCTIIDNNSLDFEDAVSGIVYLLANGEEDKYNNLIDLLEEPNITQIIYAIDGDSKSKIKFDSDKFMWIIRYGLCAGNEEKTKRMYEIITGRIAVDIISN
jgi:hypothetical protein